MGQQVTTRTTKSHYNFKWTLFCDILVQWKLATFINKPDNSLNQELPTFIPMSPLQMNETFAADIACFFKIDPFYINKVRSIEIFEKRVFL